MSIPVRHIGTGTYKPNKRTRELINQILDRGRISYGEVSRKFEKLFAQEHNSLYAILSNSGTSSLHVALQALKELHGWGDGGEVIVPATTFVATANIVLHNRMTPVFVDVHSDTGNINPQLIEDAITKKTRAIIPVHLFGHPAEMDKVAGLALSHNLKVLEDSCETMFATYAGRKVGSWGDIGAFSLYMAHLLVAGVGGISTTDNPDLAGIMRSLVNHGLSLDNLNPDKNFAPSFMLGRRFYFDKTGHSFRITEFEAALALAQLEEDPQETIVKPRQQNAQRLIDGIEGLNDEVGGEWLSTMGTYPHATHSWMMFPIVIGKDAPELFEKDRITEYLNSRDIETRDMLPILNQPAFSYLKVEDYPVSQHIIDKGFYIGCHQGLSDEDIDYVLQELAFYYALA